MPYHARSVCIVINLNRQQHQNIQILIWNLFLEKKDKKKVRMKKE